MQKFLSFSLFLGFFGFQSLFYRIFDSTHMLQVHQLMTSQIRSDVEYLIQTYDGFLYSFYSQNWWKSSLADGFNTI